MADHAQIPDEVETRAPQGFFDRLVDSADRLTDRFRVPLSVLSVGWFALTCADYAGFVQLPGFALISGMPGLIASGIFNALWWGLVYPRAEKRRFDRSQSSNSLKANVDG